MATGLKCLLSFLPDVLGGTVVSGVQERSVALCLTECGPWRSLMTKVAPWEGSSWLVTEKDGEEDHGGWGGRERASWRR